MTRQEKLAEIGKMGLLEYGSKVIIPVPHRFYENTEEIFSEIEKAGWSILNMQDMKQFGAYNIKTYIYENMIPNLNHTDTKSYLTESKTVVLNKKLEQKVKIDTFDFIITDMDLWILEEHIAFFVLNVDIDYKSYSVDELILFHRLLRNFKFLNVVKEDDSILLQTRKITEGEGFEFLEKFLSYTFTVEKKSFLNISLIDCKYTDEKEANNYLYPIYNSSINAKLLVGMQLNQTTYSDGSEIELFDTQCVSFDAVEEMGILDEVPFYIATCSSMEGVDKSFIAHDDYIYKLINENGYNLWKYSSGVTIHDSSVFFGLGKDCGPLVSNMQNSFYFIYMLNLYINFQLRYIEHRLIDENFESIDINYWYKKLQKLKNQFITTDIAIKFQENEVHNSMSQALKNSLMIGEVTDNLLETKNITQNNRGLYLTLFGFIFVTIVQEPLNNFLTPYLIKYSSYIIPAMLSILGIIFIYRAKILKYFKL